MSTASTFASFSSNNETASMCPYATASISGVLGKEGNQAFKKIKKIFTTSSGRISLSPSLCLSLSQSLSPLDNCLIFSEGPQLAICHLEQAICLWSLMATWNGGSGLINTGGAQEGSTSKCSFEFHHFQNYVALTKYQLSKECVYVRDALASTRAALLSWFSTSDFGSRFYLNKASLP